MRIAPDGRRRRFLKTAGVLVAAGITGCIGDDAGTDGTPTPADEPFDAVDLSEFSLHDRAADTHDPVAYVHGDHWHGSIPPIPLGETYSLGARAEAQDGSPLDLGEWYELRVAVAPGSDELLSIENHGDHVHLVGDAVGVTEVAVRLLDDGNAVYQTPPITVQVTEDPEHDHFDAHRVSSVTIYDRAPDPHESVAEWHDEHWHGELPTVSVDDHVSVGAAFEDADGNEADLSTEYGLRVAIADGADDLLAFDFHGDHVHLIGESAGETEVVFQLWHGDHADFTTTPIEVTIED